MGSFGPSAAILGLCSLLTVTWGSVLEKPELHGPLVSLVGTIEYFHCFMKNVSATDLYLIELYLENDTKPLGEFTLHAGAHAEFPLKVKEEYDGNLFCKASVQNMSTVPATFSELHRLRVIVPVEGVEIVSDPPSAEVFEGQNLTLTCVVKQGTYVSYEWHHNGTLHYARDSQLHLEQAAPEDAGNYSCQARNQFNITLDYLSFNFIYIWVKAPTVPISKPEISITVQMEEDEYLANVTCHSDKGTPPVNFTFLHRKGSDETRTDLMVEDSLRASITLPILLNRNEGDVRCRAASGHLALDSDPLALEVESVGGAVTLTAQKVIHYSRVVALTLHCEVERGTFPRFHWFLNNTKLEGRDAYTGQTLRLTSIAARNSGFYHCVVADSFDKTNTINSEKLFIDKKALHYTSVVVVSVVVGCFLFLVCLVTACCVYGAIYGRRLTPVKPRLPFISPAADSLESEDEDPVENEYMEDVELVRAANLEYAGKGEEDSAESVDEWPEIERALQISCMDETVPPS